MHLTDIRARLLANECECSCRFTQGEEIQRRVRRVLVQGAEIQRRSIECACLMTSLPKHMGHTSLFTPASASPLLFSSLGPLLLPSGELDRSPSTLSMDGSRPVAQNPPRITPAATPWVMSHCGSPTAAITAPEPRRRSALPRRAPPQTRDALPPAEALVLAGGS